MNSPTAPYGRLFHSHTPWSNQHIYFDTMGCCDGATQRIEAGIDIMARPPGKQLQSITLLSGGEQTMTAVALLFSIYQVKPSPFCVLDELDAPLDESNIMRFVRVLQRFLTQSQFVVITHNKRTIGMADALYGITMEEHGISKVVSVKFRPRFSVSSSHRKGRPGGAPRR